jgi:hypothetical protein
VWGRAEARLVRIFNVRFEPIAVHARAEPGRFVTADAHIHSRKRAIIERGADYLLERCRLLGSHCGAWPEGMMALRGPIELRVLQGHRIEVGSNSDLSHDINFRKRRSRVRTVQYLACGMSGVNFSAG